ncbi:MAG TPA: DUF4340 domain-containing protein [Anaeromyxobacteraceae bacterium]|nr:DUF4340 domain-containing protein [Anaeromyxobacteraceae bacterium]
MSARSRTLLSTLVLLSLAGAAVGFAYFGVEKKNEAAEAKKAAEEKLYSFSRSKVKAVTVEAKGETTKLVRSGEEWRVEAPVHAEADQLVIDSLLDGVIELHRKAAIAPAAGPDALARYGLSKPRARVVIALDDGKIETLALGDENEFDGTEYALTTSGAVDLVNASVKWAIEKTPFDLRDKTILRFDRDKVVAIRFSSGGSSFEAGKDSPRLSSAISTLSALRAKAFVDDSGRSRDEHGLARPAREVLLLGDGRKQLERLIVSPERGGKTFAQAASSPRVVEIDASGLAPLPTSAHDLDEKPAPKAEASAGKQPGVDPGRRAP